jgi:hypothetical protein
MSSTPAPLPLFLALAELACDQFAVASESLDAAIPPEDDHILRHDLESCANAFAVFGNLLATVYGERADAALVEQLTVILPERVPFSYARLLERLTGRPHQAGNYVQDGPDWASREERERIFWPANRAHIVGELTVKALAALLSSEPIAQPAATAVRDSLDLLIGMVNSEVVFSDLADERPEQFVMGCLPGEDDEEEAEEESDIEALVAAAV